MEYVDHLDADNSFTGSLPSAGYEKDEVNNTEQVVKKIGEQIKGDASPNLGIVRNTVRGGRGERGDVKNYGYYRQVDCERQQPASKRGKDTIIGIELLCGTVIVWREIG